MPITSKTILPSQTHAGDSAVETVTGDKYKGDGYYGRSDGLHTVQYSYTEFTGLISIQATLAIDPVEEDWFTVHTNALTQDSDSEIHNFTGNYVWIRASVIYTDGSVNSIILNH